MKKLMAFCILCAILFTSCEQPEYRGDAGLIACLRYEAPTFSFMGGETEEIEKDEYGRILYQYIIPAENSGFLGVCQSETNEKVSFYQDISVIVHHKGDRGGSSFSADEILQLKEMNDWGKSLNEEKMTVVDFKNRQEKAYWYNDYEQLENAYGIGKISTCSPVCQDGIGNQLFYIWSKKDGVNVLYFFIQDGDRHIKNETAIELIDWPNFQPQLHEFKKKNGWDFSRGYLL